MLVAGCAARDATAVSLLRRSKPRTCRTTPPSRHGGEIGGPGLQGLALRTAPIGAYEPIFAGNGNRQGGSQVIVQGHRHSTLQRASFSRPAQG